VRAERKRLVAVVLGAVLGVVLIVAIAFGDVGDPDVPEGSVAVIEEVDGGEVSQEDLDRAIAQQAARQQLRRPPAEDDPQYELVRDAAFADLLLTRWVRGEAAERGIEVSDREVDQQLEQVIEEQFGGQKQFDRFLEQQSYTAAEARERVQLGVLSDRIQTDVLGEEPPTVDQSLVEAFYEESKGEQFTQPETRDVREILNPDAEKVAQARTELEADDSDASWRKVAKRFSTDDASRNEGGLRRAVSEGQGDPALDEQIFSAPQGELVGPFEAEAGSYLIQVTEITPEQVTPLSEAEEQIRQQLSSAAQQDLGAAFQTGFLGKWTSRTFCAAEVTIDRCANAPAVADSCPTDDEDPEREATLEAGCDAFVPSTRPVPPGQAGLFGGAAQGAPQGPLGPAAAQAEGVPPGLSPVPPGAAPGAAPGAPPTAPPPGAAPPGG